MRNRSICLVAATNCRSRPAKGEASESQLPALQFAIRARSLRDCIVVARRAQWMLGGQNISLEESWECEARSSRKTVTKSQ